MIDYITDIQIYNEVVLGRIPQAREFLWIGTSDIKDMYVGKKKRMIPFLEVLSGLIDDGVSVRLIHAREPGPAFREDFDRYPNLFSGLERLLCPRVHFKMVIIDEKFAYSGSANLTGAGMGAKSKTRRNFEGGIITDEPELIDKIMEQFDSVWMGRYCKECRRKEHCSDYVDMIRG